MKTLDEVIKMLEDAIDTTDADCPMMILVEGDATDTLHYLKDYRMLAADIAEKRKQLEAEKDRYQESVKNCEAAENKYRQLSEELSKTSAELGNEPLTWEELREMGGKPVWVEIIGRTIPLDSSWGIATRGSYKTWQGVESWTLVRPGIEYSLPVADYGKTWQAYRKELTHE